jgi:hypothetical protein
MKIGTELQGKGAEDKKTSEAEYADKEEEKKDDKKDDKKEDK